MPKVTQLMSGTVKIQTQPYSRVCSQSLCYINKIHRPARPRDTRKVQHSETVEVSRMLKGLNSLGVSKLFSNSVMGENGMSHICLQIHLSMLLEGGALPPSLLSFPTPFVLLRHQLLPSVPP